MAADDRPTGAHESEIGLTGYATSTPGLGGRLKTRIQDFVVDEVAAPPVPDPRGAFVAARIQLTNWETNAFVREASHRLGISRKKVHYSGTKDKRGVTEQWFTFEAEPAAVAELSRTGGVEVLEAVRTGKEVELGDHVANRFRVVLRGIDLPAAEVERRLAATWAELGSMGGAPNVFGPQRFGARRPTTHKVGERIVRGDFLGAVLAYVHDPLAITGERLAHYHAALDAADWAGALAALEGDVPFERALLHRLVETGDPVEALRALAPNLQRLFVHAYQSWLFNRMVDERLARGLGLARPLLGDLVAPIEDGLVEETWVPVSAANLERVRDELARGRAVLTGLLPGTEAPAAEGPMGAIERGVLRAERIAPRDFLVPENLEWSSRGTRRALVAPVRGLRCAVADDDLAPGARRVDLAFELPPGAYATSVLREFMKSGDLARYG